MSAPNGSLAVIDVRLEALERSLERLRASSADRPAWRQVTWELERLRSAVNKALAGGAPRGTGGRPR